MSNRTGLKQSSTPLTNVSQILRTLSTGTIELQGQFVWGSNYTFLVKVQNQAKQPVFAVYKPLQGERPLWDFPRFSLAKREVAAYRTSQALGWNHVPPTVLCPDGPAGPGSLQLFVDVDPERHYYTFNQQERERLRPVALFDIIINNADRKAGHVLLGPEKNIWLIDHGVCFHQTYKLRTVIWDFVAQQIPDPLLHELGAFSERLQDVDFVESTYEALLSIDEIEAMQARVEALIKEGVFPEPRQDRPFPWPLV
jgi:uncharacterized repeat protein (TIGR03843 family)